MKKLIIALCYTVLIVAFSGCHIKVSTNSEQSSLKINQTDVQNEEFSVSNMGEKFLNIDYNYDNTSQTLEIYGKGQMNWDMHSSEYIELCQNVVPKKLVISPGITSIQDYVFSYSIEGNSGKAENHFNQIETVVLPDSLTEIGAGSFDCCTGVKSVSIPDSVKKVGDFAFYNCSALKTVDIPEGVTAIGAMAFKECKILNDIKFPSTLNSVEEEVCSQCEQLKDVVVQSGIAEIKDGAFSDCTNLKNVELGDTITSIGDYSFFNCIELKSVTISKSVKTIGEFAFGYYNVSTADGSEMIKTPKKDFTIYGYKNTAAEKYAQENGLNFVNLEDN